MTKFSSEWLALREDADARARNADVADALAARFQLRDSVSVVDLGCGAGANLRATSALLPPRQSWTLVDHDEAHLSNARARLGAWADTARSDGDGRMTLTKDAAVIDVAFVQRDLARDLSDVLSAPADLVSASALFDLTSPQFIRQMARAIADMRASFYGVLTYNGVQKWSPHRPADNQIASGFHRHQMQDKGFGPAAGPTAPAHLADQFRINGYAVIEGDSPWRLGRGDRMLIDEIARGCAMAASETGLVDDKTVEAWVKTQRSGAETGHTDIFAAPT